MERSSVERERGARDEAGRRGKGGRGGSWGRASSNLVQPHRITHVDCLVTECLVVVHLVEV